MTPNEEIKIAERRAEIVARKMHWREQLSALKSRALISTAIKKAFVGLEWKKWDADKKITRTPVIHTLQGADALALMELYKENSQENEHTTDSHFLVGSYHTNASSPSDAPTYVGFDRENQTAQLKQLVKMGLKFEGNRPYGGRGRAEPNQ